MFIFPDGAPGYDTVHTTVELLNFADVSQPMKYRDFGHEITHTKKNNGVNQRIVRCVDDYDTTAERNFRFSIVTIHIWS
jgi:hypothetical protein